MQFMIGELLSINLSPFIFFARTGIFDCKEIYALKFSHNKTRKRIWKIVLCTLGPNIGNPSKDHNNMNVFAKMIKLCKSVVGGSSTFTAFSRTALKKRRRKD